jgi:hypothetical protein
VNDVPDADRTVAAGRPTPPADAGSVPAAAPSGQPTPQAPPERVMELLADHVPLALLMDLVAPDGPASADILRDEGMPDDAWWEPEHAEPEPADGQATHPGTAPASDDPEATA